MSSKDTEEVLMEDYTSDTSWLVVGRLNFSRCLLFDDRRKDFRAFKIN